MTAPLPAPHRSPRVEDEAGHEASFVGYRDKTLDTVLGPVRLKRANYRWAECNAGLAPRDAELGVTRASLSPGLAAMVDRVATAGALKGRGLLAELAGVELTTKRVERRAEADGQAVGSAISAEAKAVAAGTVVLLGPTEPVDKLYVAVDGTGVPTVPADTSGCPGKGADGRTHTRDVKLGCLFTQRALDEEGCPIRDPDSSSYVATLEPVANFGPLVFAEARRRGSARARRLIVLGDGAPWIWNLATKHFPGATQIVGLFHAREHLHDLSALVASALGEGGPAWLAERLADLDRGDVAALLASARKLSLPDAKAAKVERALGYFESNSERMRYAHFRELGFFVGSGAIEAGCRAVVAQRLKLSGMRWSVRGASAIVNLRCEEAGGRWEEIWMRANTQTSVA